MLDALVDPGVSHKFVKSLQGLKGAKIYRKSGTWRTYHADSALVRYYGHAYIIVALANHPNGSLWLENMALPLHKLAVAESWAAIQQRQ
jgi:beta-lactamase class A